jgi:uncharacterized protein (DUF1499 family)
MEKLKIKMKNDRLKIENEITENQHSLCQDDILTQDSVGVIEHNQAKPRNLLIRLLGGNNRFISFASAFKFFVFSFCILSFAFCVGTANASTAGPNTPSTMATTTISGGTTDWSIPLSNGELEDGVMTQANVGVDGGHSAPCLSPDTLVSAQGGNIAVKNLKIGDLIYSYNFALKITELKRVINVISTSISEANNDYYHIYFNGGDVRATYNHAFYVGDQLVMAKDLKIGDELSGVDGATHVITNVIIEENHTDNVWDVSVEDNNNFFANGVLVHNAGSVFDNSVQLIKGGTVGSNDASSSIAWGSALATSTYGGSTNLWGNSWTASDVSTSTFGVAISAKGSGYSGSNNTSFYLKATNFGFSIPAGSTINGIIVNIKKEYVGCGSGGTCAGIDTINITVYYTSAASTSSGVMSSSNYKLESDSLNFGGGYSTSTNYIQESTGGEVATGFSSSTNYILSAGYQQMNTVALSLVPPPSVVMSPSIGGVTGGTSNGSTTFTVTTDDPAGYQAIIQASSSPALVNTSSSTNAFADYSPAGSAPDFTFGIAATASAFAFSPQGTDADQRFLNNTSICNTGTNSTAQTCWDGLSTGAKTIADRTSANSPSGIQTTLYFRAASGTNHIQVNGVYVATTTLTVLPL